MTTDYSPGDKVRVHVTYETLIHKDGGIPFSSVFRKHIGPLGGTFETEVIERHNPRTTEPVGTVVKLDTFPATYDYMYVVKIGTDLWADLGIGSQAGNVRIFTDADNADAEYVGHVSELDDDARVPFVRRTERTSTPTTDVSRKPVRWWLGASGSTAKPFVRKFDDGSYEECYPNGVWHSANYSGIETDDRFQECDEYGNALVPPPAEYTYFHDNDGDVWRVDSSGIACMWCPLLSPSQWNTHEPEQIEYVLATFGPIDPLTRAELTTEQRNGDN